MFFIVYLHQPENNAQVARETQSETTILFQNDNVGWALSRRILVGLQWFNRAKIPQHNRLDADSYFFSKTSEQQTAPISLKVQYKC